MEPTIARQPESVQTNQSMTPTDTPIEALEEGGATAGMPLFLQRSSRSQIVQREDTLPPIPDFQLTPPSLLQPPDPTSRYSLGLNYHLDLDPQLTIQQTTLQILDPAILKLQLTQLDLATVPSFIPKRSSAEATLAAVLPEQPATPRSATPGDLLKGIVKVPAVDRALTTLQTRVSDRAEADWRHLKLGEKVGVISAFTVIGAGTLAGIISSPEARRFSLGQLNGQVLPVPKVDWLHLEINTQGNNLMLGFHLDVGQLLPSVLGFRASSPKAIGVPQPTIIPGQRTIQCAENHTNETTQDSIGQRIQAASGGGDSLDAGIQQHLEQTLGADLSSVQIHTDGEADRLSRSVNALAFTMGQDIFFSAGSYDPRSSEGQQLIAHEVVHTLQQASGAVAGAATADGVSISDPADSFEQEADRIAQQVMTLP